MMNDIVIYGGGKTGRSCLDFLKWRGMGERVYAFCDRDYASIKEIDGKKVISPEDIKNLHIPIVVAIKNVQFRNEVLEEIKSLGVQEVYEVGEIYKALREEQTVYYREWCGYHHAKNNDAYFDGAEDEESLRVFWQEDSPFFKKFQKLDLSNVIELACGRGRHVQKYISNADKITLVDICEENIEICEERYKDYSHIVFYKNNGYNLEKLEDSKYSALFTYDSMVHFEMMDVYEYLKDIYRVLQDGGKALLHHSNYADDYTVNFAKEYHGRCFMSKNIFAYLAYRIGFKILNQEIIDWYGEKQLDCITLLEK